MGMNAKAQTAVSIQLQNILNTPSRGIRVLSSETIGHFLKKNYCIYILTIDSHFARALRCTCMSSRIAQSLWKRHAQLVPRLCTMVKNVG